MTGASTQPSIAPPKSPRKASKLLWRPHLAAIAIVLCATVLAAVFFEYLTARVSMILLAGVLITGLQLGTKPAIGSALLSSVAYGFFLAASNAPRGLQSPGDIVALSVFLIVSMPTGTLAGRARDARLRDREQGRATEALFQASSALSASVEEDEIRDALAARIGDAAGGAAFVFEQGSVWPSPGAVVPAHKLFEDAQTALAAGGCDRSIRLGEWQARVMYAGGHQLGMALWQSGTSADPTRRDLITVLVDLGAAAVARARLAVERAEVEGLARNQQLLSTLLTSISHDFRTPLAAILASASSLRTYGSTFPRNVSDDLLATIEEEAERLNRFVANLLNMTKLESGVFKHDIQVIDVAEVLHQLAAQIEKGAGPDTRLLVDIRDGHRVRTDPLLFEQALRNVIDNAVRFSPSGASVRIGARAADDLVHIEIVDSGPGVEDGEASRIFDKFFRSAKAVPGSGTGLGLAITRGLIEALGGKVSAANLQPPEHGLQVTISMPLATA